MEEKEDGVIGRGTRVEEEEVVERNREETGIGRRGGKK